jgi:hypothetical protein
LASLLRRIALGKTDESDLKLTPQLRDIPVSLLAQSAAPRWSRSRQRRVSAARRFLKASVFSPIAHPGRRQCRDHHEVRHLHLGIVIKSRWFDDCCLNHLCPQAAVITDIGVDAQK